MICIDIEVTGSYNNYLQRIFEGVNLSGYEWEIITDDTLFSEGGLTKQGIFTNKLISGTEFYKCIAKEQYLMIFVDIKAYPIGKEHVEIKTLNDFLKSNCELVFVCVDSWYINIYCKNEEVLKAIFNNCKDDDFKKVEYLSEEEIAERSLIAF
jgi:hypothetical protein